ncbi:aldehyde dehydrogenase family protein [Sphingobium sp. 3R8]|uniref:aldehyde dehydrogenase family protein n=1 Tax=Sphingobium sp. 3R8 TaxID=2874921 RepID=UPI001CC9D652|nr:aldehyde dehydrogenase family protein [Sphingobium sp. 3R8]MBZ9646903.1 aldehyde dehydrogenase family protein [Sphingobium sp. 3R8]
MTIPEFSHLIGGHCVRGASTFEVINPATEEIVGLAPDATVAQLNLAVASARAAFPAWRDLDLTERQAKVAALAGVFAANIDELKRLLTAEQGKPLDDAQVDIMTGSYFCQLSSMLTPPVEVNEDSAERLSVTRHVPLGVVGAIAPWNVPIGLAFWKVAPALVAGNTVVLKPSPFTPLTTLRIAELLREMLPPGVLNVLSGGDRLGPWMTSHPGLDKISFTGSTATGRKVMESAAATLKRVTLELGGNDAAIVLPGVNVAEVAEKLFQAAFGNSGQICIATKRLYVHDAIYDAFADAMVALADTAKIGDGAEQGTRFGPIQNRAQFDRVQDLIADSREQGHRFLTGLDQAVPERGWFIPLTIIDNPPSNARIVQEEQFGPVLPLLRFDDVDTAIALANDTDYGLGASVWGPSEQAALIAERLEAGTVWVNEVQTVSPSAPFGGHKQSGIGSENGLHGLLEYTNPKVISIAKTAGRGVNGSST